jgi:methionine sulfoxide reductase heme-binding subunit
MMNKLNVWWIIFLLGLTPLAWLLIDIQFNRLGANPIEAVHIFLGDWTLRFLCLSLTISPLNKMTTWKWPLRYRRMIGLFTFFYATLHLLNYAILDHALAWCMIGMDIIESPFIIMGLITYLILLPMAVTSTKAWQRHLGVYWKKLHRLIYVASITGVIHYVWQLKGNLVQPLTYAFIVALLLGFRVFEWRRVIRRNP